MKTKKAKFMLVKFDSTQNWDEDYLRQMGITKATTWYLFDANAVTHCCEITPSYYLMPVYEGFDNEDQLSDAQIDDLQYQGNLSEFDIYVHCSQVDPIAKELPLEFEVEYLYDEELGSDGSYDAYLYAIDIFIQGYMHLL
jgi:hypothetical protein